MIYTENEIKGTASISKSSLVAKIAVAEVITVDTEEVKEEESVPEIEQDIICLLYTSPSPRDRTRSRMPSSA